MQLISVPASKTAVIWASGVNALKNPIPNTSQIGRVNGAASFTDGFPPLNFTPVASGGVPPFGKDANGLLNQMTAWDQWFQAGGAVRYDATFQTQIGGYPAQARVGSVTTPFLVWQSTTDNNTTNPDAGGAGWQTPVFPDPNTTAPASPPPGGLTVTAAPGAASNGASLLLYGNGTAAPRKWLRAYSGLFQVINNTNTASIFTLDDAGNVSNIGDVHANGTVSAYSLIANGTPPTGGNATIAGQATADSLQIGTTVHPPGSGYGYFLKGIESGGTLKVDNFAQLAGAVNIGGVDASIYWTNNGGTNWGGMYGFIHRKFSGSTYKNTYGVDQVTLGVWTGGGSVEAATNVVTIDTNGGITAAGEVAVADTVDPTGARGFVMGIVNDSSRARYISFSEPLGTNKVPWQLRWERYGAGGSFELFGWFSGGDSTRPLFTVDPNGNGVFAGSVHATNVTAMETAIAALTTRLAALERR